MQSIARYPLSIRVLHWFMAIGIIGLIISGWYMAGLANDAANKYDLYPLHKSFGVLVIISLAFRVFARISAQRKALIPSAPSVLKAWEKQSSHVAHLSLYLLMAAVPVSGYVMSGAYEYGHGIDFFWTTLPNLVPTDKTLFDNAKSLHGPMAYGLTALVVIHLAAVIKHRVFDTKAADVLPRMLRG
jgi:cytochrome b561